MDLRYYAHPVASFGATFDAVTSASTTTLTRSSSSNPPVSARNPTQFLLHVASRRQWQHETQFLVVVVMDQRSTMIEDSNEVDGWMIFSNKNPRSHRNQKELASKGSVLLWESECCYNRATIH